MQFSTPLIKAKLIRRYKRFLCDFYDQNGNIHTASVPNTGSMLGLTAPNSNIWLSTSDDPKRKYKHRLEIVESENILVGVNTSLPNKIAREALDTPLLPEFADYTHIYPEQCYGQNSRIDFLLNASALPDLYLEVKNVHFIRQSRIAEFPDTVTQRGTRHLEELIKIVQSGKRGVMLFVIQREDCDIFRVCKDLDPTYGKAFDKALNAGVEAYAIKCQVTPESICAVARIKIEN